MIYKLSSDRYFSIVVEQLYNTVDGRKHPEEYWRNLRVLVPMRKATEQKPKVILSIDEFKYHNAATDAEEKPLGTSSEPVGSGGGTGGGDRKVHKHLFKQYGPKVPAN